MTAQSRSGKVVLPKTRGITGEVFCGGQRNNITSHELRWTGSYISGRLIVPRTARRGYGQYCLQWRNLIMRMLSRLFRCAVGEVSSASQVVSELTRQPL